MPSTATDRLAGLTTSVAVKAPVKAVSTANLTLSGEQTVGGVAVVEGDRVLVRAQSTGSQNGIYVAKATAWVRAKDFDGARDVVSGTLIVANFDNGNGLIYRVTTSDPITIDTTSLSISPVVDPNQIVPITEAEAAAGVTPTNYEYPEGNVLRYGTNATPGTTDMSSALQAAVDVALAALGSGYAGVPVYLPRGAYLITTPPTFGTDADFRPIVICGDGNGTQIINNAAASTSATFNMAGVQGWTIRDLLLCGNSVHKNDGIRIDGSVASSNFWHIENVTSVMPGYGIYAKQTNTGVIRNFVSWPGITDDMLHVPQSVTMTDVNPHIYLTGSFAHNISIYDAWVMPNSSYGAGHRGIKVDASQCQGLNIIGGLMQTLSGLNTETAITLDGNVFGAVIQGVYHEGAIVELKNVYNSRISGLTDGSILGSLVLNSNTGRNTIDSMSLAVIELTGVGVVNNTLINCTARTTFTNTAPASNRLINCSMAGVEYEDHGGAGTPQTLTGAGAVNLTTRTTLLVTTGANALTLADGIEGQRKVIVMKTDGGDGTLTPTNRHGYATITFNDAGDSIELNFTDGKWAIVGGNGCTIA
jgi:hypothetical protein